MKSKRIIIIAVLIAVCVTLFFFLNANLRFVYYSAPEYTEISNSIENPYTGWYQIFSYCLSEEDLDLSNIEKSNYGPELLLLEIDLRNYISAPLSDNALSSLNSLLSMCRLKGKQIILRFMYDNNGNLSIYEPDDISVIINHMTQTSKIINQYTDCVYIIQGLYIGSWGEMHNTAYDKTEDIDTLANHLNSVIDPSIFFAVRTPSMWRTISHTNEPIAADLAFNGTLISRLGLFNDGILGSETDLGTYADSAPNSDKKNGKYPREAEIAFQNRLCNYVPNGGEVVYDNSYNDFEAAIEYLKNTHVSYLNRQYDMDVLAKWQASAYSGEGAFKGVNGYDYIGNHLGYRYVVRSSEIYYPYPWSKNASLRVFIENAGFSPAYRSFDVTLLVKNTSSGEEYIIPVDTDTRFWTALEKTQIEIPLEIYNYPNGTYNLFLKISDPVSGYDVYFANESANTINGISLGSVNIGQFIDF